MNTRSIICVIIISAIIENLVHFKVDLFYNCVSLYNYNNYYFHSIIIIIQNSYCESDWTNKHCF